MKITIVLGAFLPVPPIMGGAIEKSWFALAQEFVSRSHDVTIVSRTFPELARHEVVDGLRHIRIRGFNTPRSLIWLKVLDLFYSLRVRRILPAADILVTNTFWLPLLMRDSSRGKIYVHVGRYPKGQMRLYRRATRLQAPSTDGAEAIKREVPRLAEKVIAIPYPRPETTLRETPLQAREKIVLYIGRVHPEKGVHILVKAFAHLCHCDFADWKLVIVGSTNVKEGGGGENYLDQLRQSAAIARDRVIFEGPTFDSLALEQKFRSARLFVYPSLAVHGETFGLAPLEAMTHGCAVLVSDLTCFRDFVSPNKTGFVFEHHPPLRLGDSSDPVDSLVRAFRQALSDPVRLEQIAHAGLLKSKEFSRTRVADQFLADFEKLIFDAERTNS
jgi:glycosyltransferase involved in cell wall biosynthesis